VSVYLLAMLIGVVVGLRAMTGPAAVGWAAWSGALALGGTRLAFLGHPWFLVVSTIVALAELINDKRASTPSRTVPVQFGGRVVSGMLCGAAIGTPAGSMIGGLLAGALGSIIGTLGGRAFRARLAKSFGKDRPAALIEDAIAIGGAILIVLAIARS
jgi:uncharacterized membrane protein